MKVGPRLWRYLQEVRNEYYFFPCLAKRLGGDVLAGVSPAGFAESQSVCASDEQAVRVKVYFAENDGLPVTAARRLEMPEIVIASALPEGEAIGTSIMLRTSGGQSATIDS